MPYHKSMKLLCIFALVYAAAGAQTVRPPAKKSAPAKKASAPEAPAPSKWPVEKLVVEGNRAYSAEQVLAVAEAT